MLRVSFHLVYSIRVNFVTIKYYYIFFLMPSSSMLEHSWEASRLNPAPSVKFFGSCLADDINPDSVDESSLE